MLENLSLALGRSNTGAVVVVLSLGAAAIDCGCTNAAAVFQCIALRAWTLRGREISDSRQRANERERVSDREKKKGGESAGLNTQDAAEAQPMCLCASCGAVPTVVPRLFCAGLL